MFGIDTDRFRRYSLGLLLTELSSVYVDDVDHYKSRALLHRKAEEHHILESGRRYLPDTPLRKVRYGRLDVQRDMDRYGSV